MSDDLIERMDSQIATWDYDEPRGDWWQYQNDYLAARERIEQLTDENEALREALKFYAGGIGREQREDGGKTAREALKEPKP
jgi:hypothetical protein